MTDGIEVTVKSESWEALQREFRQDSRFGKGLVGGLCGAVMGAVLWVAFTITWDDLFVPLAIVPGLLAGYGVRLMGQGIDLKFRFAGAAMALLASVLTHLAWLGWQLGARTLGELALELWAVDWPRTLQSLFEQTQVMDWIFYAIAVYAGWLFSLRAITRQELWECLAEDPPWVKKKTKKPRCRKPDSPWRIEEDLGGSAGADPEGVDGTEGGVTLPDRPDQVTRI